MTSTIARRGDARRPASSALACLERVTRLRAPAIEASR
jgi:hypothetical protein